MTYTITGLFLELFESALKHWVPGGIITHAYFQRSPSDNTSPSSSASLAIPALNLAAGGDVDLSGFNFRLPLFACGSSTFVFNYSFVADGRPLAFDVLTKIPIRNNPQFQLTIPVSTKFYSYSDLPLPYVLASHLFFPLKSRNSRSYFDSLIEIRGD